MEPGDPDVHQRIHLVAEAAGDPRGLRGDRSVGRSRGNHGNRALALEGHLGGTEPQGSRQRIVVSRPERFAHPGGDLVLHPGDEHVLLRAAQRAHDVGDLRRALARGKHDLG